MFTVYLAMFAVGSIAVLTALMLSDFDFGGHDGLPFLSLTGVSAALLGAGAGGLICTWSGVSPVGGAFVAAASGIGLFATCQGLLLPYLRRQQSNSARGRDSYIGLLGTVTLEIAPGGWGEVAFVDADGNRVRSRAVTAERVPLTKSMQVYISDVDANQVHVVATEDPSKPSELS